MTCSRVTYIFYIPKISNWPCMRLDFDLSHIIWDTGDPRFIPRESFIYHIFTLLSIELFMFIHSPIYYIFICLSTYLSTHVFIYSSIHSFTHSLTYLSIYCYSSFNYSHIYLFVYLFHSHLSFNSPKLYTVKFILIHFTQIETR